MLRFLLVLLAVVLGCATALHAQEEPSRTQAIELAGRVLDRDGQPLAGAYVLVDIRRDKACKTASVRTERDGAFRYTAEEPGEFTLSVVKPAHGRADLALGELAAGTRRTDLVLRLGAGNAIAGRVQFADGSPAEAFVTVSNDGGAWLHARADGLGPSEWLQVEFEAGPQQERDLHLQPSESIQGLVRDLGGRAADQAEIDARSPYGWWQARTGPDGRFVLTDLPLGEVELHARLASGIGLERKATVVAGTPCEVTLAPAGEALVRLSGRVRVGDGSVPWSGYALRDRERDTYPIVKTGDGRYSLALPGAGAWEIRIACGGGLAANGLHWRLQLELGNESEQSLDLELPLVHLRGRVTDASGVPVAKARVYAYQQREGSTRVTASSVGTDAEGRYDLLVSPGTYNLSVTTDKDKLELEGLVIGSQDPAPRDFVLAATPR